MLLLGPLALAFWGLERERQACRCLMALSGAWQCPTLGPCHGGTPLPATCAVATLASAWRPALAPAHRLLRVVPASLSSCGAVACFLPSCGQPCGRVVGSGPGQKLTRASSYHRGALERRVRWLVSVGGAATLPQPSTVLCHLGLRSRAPSPEDRGCCRVTWARRRRRDQNSAEEGPVWWRGRGVVEGLRGVALSPQMP